MREMREIWTLKNIFSDVHMVNGNENNWKDWLNQKLYAPTVHSDVKNVQINIYNRRASENGDIEWNEYGITDKG